MGGATASTYVLGAEDVGHTLRVTVTASNAGGSAAASSAESPIVVVPFAPESTALPTIAGVPEEGWRLQASSGTWSGTQPIAYAYQWLRCSEAGDDCAEILDADDQSYLAAADDVGHTLRVAVTASNSAGSSVATSLPTEPVAPAPAHEGGIWISAGELAGLPMSGPAWDQLKATADGSLGTAKIADQNSNHDVRTLAVALVYGRTGAAEYRAKAADAIMSAIETENGGGSLALARNLASYVLAADLVDLRGYDAAKEERFRTWLDGVRFEDLSGRTLISTHEDRPNNWGTMAGASRAAAAVYLGDAADLARTAQVFLGWPGDRSSYAGFRYGSDLSWHADPTQPVGVNPLGAVKEGHSIDGVLPDDMRRGCSFRFPPCPTGYVWGALQGATVQAQILFRQGHPAWDREDLALRRAVQFLFDLDAQYPDDGWWASGDDNFIPWLTNFAYLSSFPTVSPISMGKNMSFTDWTHGSAASGSTSTSSTAARWTAGAAEPATPAGDTRPPTLVSLRLPGESVDVDAGQAVVEMRAEISDAGSGVRDGGSLVRLQSPSGTQVVEGRFVRAGGDDFVAPVAIPAGAEPGIWTVSLLVLEDNAGNRDALAAVDLNYENDLYATIAVNVPPDRKPPLLEVPSDVFLGATSPRGARFAFTASAHDDLDATPDVFCTHPSYGWVFPVGTTTVTCTAKDDSGNEARRPFSVVVRRP